MSDAMNGANINAIITVAARRKIVQARAGAILLPRIAEMAFGDGGVDGMGNVIPPTENQTTLRSELIRKPIDSYQFIGETTCRYECTLDEGELVGQSISEIALVDEQGDVVCIKTFTSKGKDTDIAQTYLLDDIF